MVELVDTEINREKEIGRDGTGLIFPHYSRMVYCRFDSYSDHRSLMFLFGYLNTSQKT